MVRWCGYQVGLDRAALQAMYQGMSESGKGDLAKAFALMAAIRNVSLLVESETLNNFLRKEFHALDYSPEEVNGFSALRTKFALPFLAKIFGNDELPPIFASPPPDLLRSFLVASYSG
jgi:hypothetical protein